MNKELEKKDKILSVEGLGNIELLFERAVNPEELKE